MEGSKLLKDRKVGLDKQKVGNHWFNVSGYDYKYDFNVKTCVCLPDLHSDEYNFNYFI